MQRLLTECFKIVACIDKNQDEKETSSLSELQELHKSSRLSGVFLYTFRDLGEPV